MAKSLAREIGYIYIDTGAMYRAVTLYCIENNLITEDGINEEALREQLPNVRVDFQQDPATKLPLTHLNGRNVEREIRTMAVSTKVSPIAALGFVREAMVRQQQLMGDQKGIVMDGRDVGTVIFPNAELKIFVTASAEIRAQRRYDELTAKGETCNYEDILKNVLERDHIDSTRAVSPLRKADDAIELDNSHMTIPEQKEWLIARFNEAIQK